VTKASQTITFGTVPASATYGSTFAVSASANSGLPVTIAASGACSISGAAVTMTSGTGTCTLTASQAGNTTYAPVSAMKTVTATKANSSTTITVNAPNPSAIAQPVTVSFSDTGITKPTGSVKVTASTGENCTGTLSAGIGNCALTFATAGPRTITAVYSGDGNFSGSTSASVNQSVNGGASTLTISPASVDFRQVPIGFLGIQNVTLKNTGATAIKISSITVAHTGTYQQDFFAVPLCPSSLAAGKSCFVLVSFIPMRNQLGAASASLIVTDSAAGSPQTVPLKGTIINPRATLSPSAVSFGSQKVGTASAIKTVMLTNSGTSPLTLTKVSTDGDFSINNTTTCTSGLSLAPAKTCKIDVKFLPRSRGQRNGAIEVNDNAFPDEQIVPLSGIGN
jgi:hypothetical protein